MGGEVDPQGTRPAEEPQGTRKRGLEPSSFTSPRASARTRTTDDLDICPTCDSSLVHPVGWQPVGRNRWCVSLRCPECEWHGGGTYEQPVIDRFDEALDRGTEELLEDLKALARANLEERIDRFADALRAGHILPEDF